MTLHIGIVGCSAEGAALCYRTLCAEAPARLGPHVHPEISMHTPSLALYVEALDRGDLQGVAALMLDSAHKLAAAGAEFLICPDNTIHQAFHLVAPRSPRPWLHIAQEVAQEAKARGFKRVGVLGTHWLVASKVYPQAFAAVGIDAVRPTDDEREAMGRIIMDELVPGRIVPASTERLRGIVARLGERGCDAVVLGCTELPLVLSDANSPLPTLDSTRLLARAALDRATAG
jgi:aspartate racemase